MKLRIIILFIFFGVIIFGFCKDNNFQPDPEHASIIIYRPKGFYGSGATLKLVLNQQEISSLMTGEYTVLKIIPDEDILFVYNYKVFKSKCDAVKLTVERGNLYYIELSLDGWDPVINFMDDDKALAEIAECDYIENSLVRD